MQEEKSPDGKQSITYAQAEVYKIASKDQARPVLECVYLHGDKVVATDSYRLLEVRAMNGQEFEPTLIHRDDIQRSLQRSKIDKAPLVEVEKRHEEEGHFPDYEPLIRDTSKEHHHTRINRKYLIDLLQAMQCEAVDLYMHTDSLSPLLLKASSVDAAGMKNDYRALLMPLKV